MSGTIANYNPDDNLIFKIGAPNIVMGTAETLYPTVEADGSFTINIPLYHSAQVRMIIGNADLVILLSPEKETNVTINLSNLPGKQFVYNGNLMSTHDWNLSFSSLDELLFILKDEYGIQIEIKQMPVDIFTFRKL